MRPKADIRRMIAQGQRWTLLDEGDDGLACRYHRPAGGVLYVVVGWGAGWDHVSVSRKNKTPTYQDMKLIKRAFFAEDEWAIEYHPPESKYISVNDNVLHLWRPQEGGIPTPPEIMV